MKDEGRRNIHGGIERVTPDEMKREGEAETGRGRAEEGGGGGVGGGTRG